MIIMDVNSYYHHLSQLITVNSHYLYAELTVNGSEGTLIAC